MRLPDRLDYIERLTDDDTGDPDTAYEVPLVICRTAGCDWTYKADWVDLYEYSDVDWDTEHPAH